MPATSSALLLTQVVWPSRLQRMTGPVGHDGVDQFLARERAGTEGGHRPAAALDPGLVRMRVGVLLDDGDVLVDRRRRIQVAAVRLDAARDRVDVHVLHARQDHAALQVDDLRSAGRCSPSRRRRCRHTRCARRRSRSSRPSCGRRPPCRSRRCAGRGPRRPISSRPPVSEASRAQPATAAAARSIPIDHARRAFMCFIIGNP